MKRKLKLQRETVCRLSPASLALVRGGDLSGATTGTALCGYTVFFNCVPNTLAGKSCPPITCTVL